MNPNFDIKSDFEIFDIEPDLIYLDSASTSLIPKVVVKATADFLSSTTVSSRRGAYRLSTKGSRLVEDIRTSLADFMQSNNYQFSFQKSIPSTVASLAYGYEWKKSGRDKIVIAQSEEHSVMVALLRAAQVLELEVQVVPVNQDGVLDLTILEEAVDDKTGIVAANHVAIGIGTRNPIRKIADISHDEGALLLTDATQSVGVSEVIPANLGADIVLCSANVGLLAPPGLAIQWTSDSIGETHRPGVLGGSAVADVMLGSFEVALHPDKFESGILNVPAIAGFGASLEYLRSLQSRNLIKHMNHISHHLVNRLSEMETLTLYGNLDSTNTILGFNVGAENGMNCHEVALFLDDQNIAVRSGLVCAHPLVKPLSKEGLIQVSLHVYNSTEDIDRLAD